MVVTSVPVYAGRVPSEAAYRIRRLKGKKSLPRVPKLNGDKPPTVLVVTYCNRAYEDALRELGDIVSEVGFKPIAAAAFICEHSWSVPEILTAHGRPDVEDLAKAEAFGKKIREKYERAEDIESLPSVVTPGKNPYSLSMRGNLTWYDLGSYLLHLQTRSSVSNVGSALMYAPQLQS